MSKKNQKQKLSRFDRLYIRDNGICWICLRWGVIIEFNRDHLIPRSLGGSDGMWNLRIAHPKCNSKRDRLPPPLDIVLVYCTDYTMVRKAKKMYYRAYPHLKQCKDGGDNGQQIVERRIKRPASVTPGPSGHKRFSSQVCLLCQAWCDTCRTCWCNAYDNDHDVLRIVRI